MSMFETSSASAAPIPRSALVASGSQAELTHALRAVAMEAASVWARSNCDKLDQAEPGEFGQKVAQAYLSALRELEANFGSELKRDWER